MALDGTYDERFEMLWRRWPKWPAGRSKKKPSYDAFVKADKALRFTDADLDFIGKNIDERVLMQATWQENYRSPRDGRPVGPPMFSTYFNQRLWNEPFERKGAAPPKRYYDVVQEPEPAHGPVDAAIAKRHIAESLAMLKGGKLH